MTKRFKKIDSPIVSYFICLGASALAMLLFSLVIAVISSFTENPGGLTDILSLVALVLSGAFCGVFTAKFGKRDSFFSAALVALAIVLIMLVICIIVNGKIGGGALMNYGCYIGMTLFSAFLGSKEKKHRKHR